MPKPRKNKLEYWKSGGQFYWHLKTPNGEIVAQGEGYESRKSVLRLFEILCSVSKKNTRFAQMVIPKEILAFDADCRKLLHKPKHFEGHLNRQWP